MKKLILSFALIISIVSASFAENIFAHRFFEIKVDVPVSVSNNLIALTDIFQKEVVIDLTKMANALPDSGVSFKTEAAPTVSIGIDIPRGLILGVNIGADVDASVGLSKDIFDFIGNGNEGKSSNFTQKTSNTYADLFAHTSLDVGWNSKQSKVKVTGSAFAALAHFDASDTYVKVYSQDNKTGFDAVVDANLYSIVDVSALASNMPDYQSLLSKLSNNLGFDVGVQYQRDLFRFLTVGGNIRMPLKPSTLDTLQKVYTKYGYEIDFNEKLGGSSSNSDEADDADEDAEDEEAENTSSNSESNGNSGKDLISKAELLANPYKINRPLKLGVTADFHPFGSLLSTTGYVGIGVRHPFASDATETKVYLDYSVKGRLSLWNILSVDVSHSRMDEVFKNQVSLAVNIRLVEVDAGVSFQSTSFVKSFEGAGVGAFVTVCVGL